MAMGIDASDERTLAVKKELDAFISEVKSSKLMNLSEVKLMKELHKKVHERFLGSYKYITPFNEIFETGKYNCVSSSALFALVLEELDIPYNIQVQPTHVYIMAYPDTKAISVEMTALKDAYYLPVRKDISRSLGILLELDLTTKEEIQKHGELQIYNEFYNSNDVVNLRQLVGIQYCNAALTASDDNNYEEAYDAICKTEILYNVDKTQFLKREFLISLLDDAEFDCLKDITYLIGYANLKKANESNVYGEYTNFINKQLLINGKKDLADSSHLYITQSLMDTILAAKLNGVFYWGLSEYYSNAYNLKKQFDYAELAYKSSPEVPGIQLWFTRCILQKLGKFSSYDEHEFEDDFEDEYDYEGEDEEKEYQDESLNLLAEYDSYVQKYPFLKTHNLFQMNYFYMCTYASNELYLENDGENGKKYFDMAIDTRDAMEDKEVLESEIVGWLYAEAGSYFYRKKDYKSALQILEEGLKFAPDHERLLVRIKYTKSKMK